MVSWFLLPITWCINLDGSPLRKDEVSYLLARVRSLFRHDFVSISLEKDLTIPSSPSEERSEWWGCFVFLRLLLSLLIVFVFLLLASWTLDIVISFLFYHISFSRERFFDSFIIGVLLLLWACYRLSVTMPYIARLSLQQGFEQRDP